jgi:putative nucleotidyltransferase with HDIG domain
MVVLWNPEVSLDDLTSLIEGDPALTVSVLRAANSAASAPITEVRVGRDAVVRLGLATVKEIATAAILSREFADLGQSGLRTSELWRHLIATALLAEEATPTPDQRAFAFTAGLLHDIGRLALAASNQARYRQVVELAEAGADVREAERSVFGVAHDSWGARICERWNLPKELGVVAGAHHGGGAGLSRLVAAARETAWSLGLGDGVVAPEEAGDGAKSPLAAVVEAVGGREGLLTRVEWLRSSFAPRS